MSVLPGLLPEFHRLHEVVDRPQLGRDYLVYWRHWVLLRLVPEVLVPVVVEVVPPLEAHPVQLEEQKEQVEGLPDVKEHKELFPELLALRPFQEDAL